MIAFTESIVEEAALAWLVSLGYAVLHLPAPQSEATRQAGGPDIALGEPAAERSDPLVCGETLTDIDNCLQFDTCHRLPTATKH